jgi:hypothetical protein
MNKIQFFFVAVISLMLSANVSAQNIDPEFFAFWQKTVELNDSRFENVDLIPIDSKVFVPISLDRDEIFFTEFIVPAPENGQHWSIWLVAEKFFSEYKAQTIPVKPAEVVTEVRKFPWILFFGALIILGFFAIFIIQPWINRKNPNYHPPVIDEGLASDLSVAHHQIQTIKDENDQRTILRLENGRFVRKYGPKKISVVMDFADNARSDIQVKPGDPMVKVSYENGDIEYYRNRCGNKMYQVYGGEERALEIPEGWEFVVTDTYQVPASTTQEPTEKKSEVQESETEAADTSQADELIKLMEGLPGNCQTAEIILSDESASVTLRFRNK